jgi:molybdopterin-guanine dinucleotide biosynthesis protein A
MLSRTHITGIILAGGKSSRMGYDKGFALHNNRPFIACIIRALQTVVNEIIIVSDNADYDQFNVKRVEDIIKDTGPLAGLYTGLFHAKTENNIVLSCDVPLVNKALLTFLINKVSNTDDIVQISVKDRTNPLLAVYKRHCITPCLRALETGERRMHTFVNQQKTKTIALDSSLEKYAQNVNTQNELNQLYNETDH